MPADGAGDQRHQRLAGFGNDEGAARGVPIQLEALHLGGNPDLADRGVGADDELGGRRFELDYQRSAAEVGFKIVALAGGQKPPVEVIQGLVGAVLKLLFVHGFEALLYQHSAQ